MILGECVRQVSKERIKKKLGSIKDLSDRQTVKRVYDANFGSLEV